MIELTKETQEQDDIIGQDDLNNAAPKLINIKEAMSYSNELEKFLFFIQMELFDNTCFFSI
jgi:hypothetical protein